MNEHFKIMQTKYGKIYINTNDRHQYPVLEHNNVPHIDIEIKNILNIIQDMHDITFVDAGANSGLITIPVAKNILGSVYSYEPQKIIFDHLQYSVNLNNLKNVNLFNLGLGDVNKFMKVPNIDYSKRRDFGNVVLRSTDNIFNCDIVEIVKLDDEIETANFIKIDVERMEYEVLLGAEKLINKNRPWCWIEYIRSDLNQLVSFFKNKNYKVYYAEKRSANIVASPDGKKYEWFGDEIK
jgi:FkbM family methyltransferase